VLELLEDRLRSPLCREKQLAGGALKLPGIVVLKIEGKVKKLSFLTL
jgi:hypothetical protein